MSDKETTFRPPSWAAQPQCRAWLEVREASNLAGPPLSTVRVDGAPYTTFGRAAEAVDVHVDDGCAPRTLRTRHACASAHSSLACSAASRLHAAIVHHETGKVYLLDLSSSGTQVDTLRCEKHRPLKIHSGFRIRFGCAAAKLVYTVRIEEGAPDGAKPHEPAVGEKRPRAEPGETVRASHLLVKHRDSRRPSSWKEEVVTRSLEQARAEVAAFRARIVANEVSFAALAERESHCSSAKRGGDLGAFGRGKMQKVFEEASFALQVGELSGLVESDSGVHIILRTA